MSSLKITNKPMKIKVRRFSRSVHGRRLKQGFRWCLNRPMVLRHKRNRIMRAGNQIKLRDTGFLLKWGKFINELKNLVLFFYVKRCLGIFQNSTKLAYYKFGIISLCLLKSLQDCSTLLWFTGLCDGAWCMLFGVVVKGNKSRAEKGVHLLVALCCKLDQGDLGLADICLQMAFSGDEFLCVYIFKLIIT